MSGLRVGRKRKNFPGGSEFTKEEFLLEAGLPKRRRQGPF